MISDTLSDAIHQIVDYLDNCEAYKNMSPLTEKLIYSALEAMEIARINLDTPPQIKKANHKLKAYHENLSN